MAGIEAALEALNSLELGESFKYSDYAELYGCNRSTLSRRHRRVQGTCASKVQDDRLLNTTQEKQLIKYINDLCERGLPPSRPMIRNFASQIAQKPCGKNWVDRFIARHSSEIISHWASGLDRNRHKADSAFKYTLYFELLKRKIEQYDIDSRDIYNMDEKGFLIGLLSKTKRVFTRSMYESGKLKHVIQDGNREWITTIACICADGSALSPALIYQAASGNIQDTWLQDFEASKHQAFFTASPTGWTNNDIGLAWLKQVFDRETKAKARSSWRLLILDGHGSHVTMDFIQYCDEKKILLAIYPPHSTHTLQPLDVVMFSLLAASYKAELAALIDRGQGLTSITKRDFFTLFYTAWSSSFKNTTLVRKAFETTGISPLNPNAILKRFKPPPEKLRPSSSSSSSSVLSASDWRKIEQLLRQAVDDLQDSNTKKLSRTIHTISVKNTLLEHENKQLKEALVNEQKRRQRGKALLLEAPPEYNGGAVFWSPQKVSDARLRQEQKDRDNQLVQHQKSVALRLREEKKAAKAQTLEERRLNRAIAKEKREREAAEKAAAREEKRIAQQLKTQLQKDLKMSQRGRKKSLQPSLAAAPPTAVQDPIEVENEDIRTSRSGRTIRRPKRLLT